MGEYGSVKTCVLPYLMQCSKKQFPLWKSSKNCISFKNRWSMSFHISKKTKLWHLYFRKLASMWSSTSSHALKLRGCHRFLDCCKNLLCNVGKINPGNTVSMITWQKTVFGRARFCCVLFYCQYFVPTTIQTRSHA